MLPSRLILERTVSEVAYIFIVLLILVAAGLSCAALLSQAVRTASNHSWSGNVNAFIIGASYAIILAVSILYCVKRRFAVRLKLQRIAKGHKTIGQSNLPQVDRFFRYISASFARVLWDHFDLQSVQKCVTQEYVRACLVAHESLPKDAFHPGWGRPGTEYNGVRFGRAVLDTLPAIDALARSVIPSLPFLKPHTRVLHHLRFILPLLPVDEDRLTALHYYDSVIQVARNSNAELSEAEYETGIRAAWAIQQSLDECYVALAEERATPFELNT